LQPVPHVPQAATQPVPQPAPQLIPQMVPQAVIQPPQAPTPEDLPPLPVLTGARLIPALTPVPGKTYRLQVGSYKIASNAVDTYVKLQKAGLNPEYERFQDFYRVIMKGIPGEDVQSASIKIEQAGFKEAIIREE